ncbi:hypothetical protein [Rhodococcus aetherivorans]|uniref:hypothetical protein n=1 Tax=Rhodococcus aetherivorans TaxID=191292 RepID=UPI0038901899
MTTDGRTAIDGLSISDLSANNELKQTIRVFIERVEAMDDKGELGFGKGSES